MKILIYMKSEEGIEQKTIVESTYFNRTQMMNIICNFQHLMVMSTEPTRQLMYEGE